MNRGNVAQSSPVQQMVAGGPNSWWGMMSSSRASLPPPPQAPPHQPLPAFYATSDMSAPPHFFPHHHYAPPPPPPPLSSWHHHNQDFPDSLSQLLMSGLMGEEDKSVLSHMQQSKKLENWEEQYLLHDQQQQQQQQHSSINVNSMVESSIKQENSSNNYGYGHDNIEFQGVKSTNWSNPMILTSSPNSCVTSLSTKMVDFPTNTFNKADRKHPPPDRSSECNSTTKKAKVQPSSSQSTFKVKKEKLGDRITSLHQIVSPFGKTDTASVLLEAFGYIRFLQNQIEALSLPYLGIEKPYNQPSSLDINGRESTQWINSVQQGERNCLFPEDPGQLLNDNCMKKKGSTLDQDSNEEPKNNLRSRGLCLVPVPCTMQIGSDNGADYWAPALNGGF